MQWNRIWGALLLIFLSRNASGFELPLPDALVPLPGQENFMNPTIYLFAKGDHKPRKWRKKVKKVPKETENGPYLDGYTSYDNAYTAWDNGYIAPLDFWEKTPETTRDSKTAEFYEAFGNYYNAIDTVGCKENNMGELRCFAWIYWGDHAFDCNIDDIHMCRKPSALEIMHHVDKHWSGKATKERVDIGRKVYFASEILQTILTKDKRYYVGNSFSTDFIAAVLMVLYRTFSKLWRTKPKRKSHHWSKDLPLKRAKYV
jgi:hypothetical protein